MYKALKIEKVDQSRLDWTKVDKQCTKVNKSEKECTGVNKCVQKWKKYKGAS